MLDDVRYRTSKELRGAPTAPRPLTKTSASTHLPGRALSEFIHRAGTGWCSKQAQLPALVRRPTERSFGLHRALVIDPVLAAHLARLQPKTARGLFEEQAH